MSTKPVLVISPGGGHLSTAFRKLTSYLESKGYTVAPVDLPSNIITIDPAASAAYPSTFDADVAAVTKAITTHADAGRDVVVLCHSYGGLPGSTACKGLLKTTRTVAGQQGGVVHVIYLASMALPLGASVLALAGGQMPPFMEVSEDGKTMQLKDSAAAFGEADMSEADLKDLLDNHIRPMAVEAFNGQCGFEAWREVEATYIHTLADTSMTPEMQKGMIAACDQAMESDGKGRKFNVVELEGGHEPFVTRPERLGDMLRKILGESV